MEWSQWSGSDPSRWQKALVGQRDNALASDKAMRPAVHVGRREAIASLWIPQSSVSQGDRLSILRGSVSLGNLSYHPHLYRLPSVESSHCPASNRAIVIVWQDVKPFLRIHSASNVDLRI